MVQSNLPLIIAVDDEPDDLFFLRRTIDKTGVAHDFQAFSNGDAAMVALAGLAAGEKPSPFPLVCFLDIKMGAMTGFDLLKWIRAQKGLEGLPVIMYSSSDYPADVESARDLGAQGYIKKYPSTDAMQTVLEEAIEFSMSPSPRRTFLQWSYRFVDSPEPVGAK